MNKRTAITALTLLLLLILGSCGTTGTSGYVAQRRQRIAIHHLENGIPVIYQQAPASPVISVKTVFTGPDLIPPPGKDGLPALTLALMSHGTENISYQQIQSFLHRTSAAIGPIGGGPEAASFNMECLNPYFSEVFDLYAALLTRPSFPDEEFIRVQRQFLMKRQQTENDPYGRTQMIASQRFFGDHPYGRESSGTMASLQQISRSDAAVLHERLMQSGRWFLVVTGSLPAEELLPRLNRTLGHYPGPPADLPTPLIEAAPIPETLPAPAETAVFREKDPASPGLAYVTGYFPLPPASHPDRPALELAFALWQDLLFEFVRTRHSACYSAWASLGGSRAGYGNITIYKSSKPEEALGFAMESLEALLAGQAVSARISTHTALEEGGGEETAEESPLVPVEEVLEFYKQQYITKFYQGETTVAARGSRVSLSWYQWGDPGAYLDRMEQIKAVSADEVIAAANRWLKEASISWTMRGDNFPLP